MKRHELNGLLNAIQRLRASATDEDALEALYAFPAWKSNAEYTTADRIRYGETLYRCIQSHTSQPDWTPDLTPALWTRVSIEEWPEWVQPLGSEDAYQTGDKVSHNGRHWTSTVDNNVWEPGAVGAETLWEHVV